MNQVELEIKQFWEKASPFFKEKVDLYYMINLVLVFSGARPSCTMPENIIASLSHFTLN